MRKFVSAALAAVTVAGTIASAGAATAQPYHHGYYGGGYWRGGHHYYRDNTGAEVAAGIAGLAIGAAIAGGGHERVYYDRGYYAPGYYYSPYYGPPAYRDCRGVEVWDPYIGRWIHRTQCW
jgi:hypothetical protein